MKRLQDSIEGKLFQHGGESGGACSHNGIHAQVESYDIVDLRVKEDVQEKARELASMLAQSEEVLHYRRAEDKINSHPRVQQLITAIKKKQKEVVAFENTFKNPEMVKKIEAEMEELQDELDSIPVVTEFQQSQADINYLLQLVISIVRDTLTEKINLDDMPKEESDDCLD
ncbi:RicAFT regulatory complex protein RicA family protein [Paenibacillus camelliae]|nr:YlbF family regulator [Paenibacillus camelliae]